MSACADDLVKERASHKTVLIKRSAGQGGFTKAPTKIFKRIKYTSKIGKMAAYLSVHKSSKKKRPAIIWLTGGFPVSSPGSYLWEKTEIGNDQTARIYRQKGIVMMFPTLRGGIKGNPGVEERFYGEVDDVISAAKYLKSLSYVDPNRIYLGGHSTGGTLALLVAESTTLFKGILALGPVSLISHYGKEGVPFAWKDKELYLRSPIFFLSGIKSTTYVVEGENGNASSIADLRKKLKKKSNSKVRLAIIKKATHFNGIYHVNKLFAEAILASKDGRLSLKKKTIEECFISYKSRKKKK